MTHNLKCWPEFFTAVLDGSKTFEVRRDDRGFAVGDDLALQEFDPTIPFDGAPPMGYTGRECVRRVTYILRAPEVNPIGGAITDGFCVMGLAMPAGMAEALRARLAACECERDQLMALLPRLVDGIRWWGAQEDGIPAKLWGAFNEAMGILGWTYSAEVDLAPMGALLHKRHEGRHSIPIGVPCGDSCCPCCTPLDSKKEGE